MRPDERECPRCGTPVAEGQEYCLECGARIPDRSGLVSSLGSAWRRRLGWYPGDWIWPALLGLLVAAAAAVVSAVWLADRSSSANGTLVFTHARSAPLPAAQAPPEPTSTTATAPATTRAAPPAARRATLTRWPPGKSGWTIVLDSVPTINGRTGAVAEAKQALRLGLKQVGVIDSASFSSLHPGYFVIFTGVYDTQAEAQSHIIDAHRHGYRGPYPRPITP
jgi:predicted outer membrane lipoprotein